VYPQHYSIIEVSLPKQEERSARRSKQEERSARRLKRSFDHKERGRSGGFALVPQQEASVESLLLFVIKSSSSIDIKERNLLLLLLRAKLECGKQVDL
jgi:mRNA-degrading endonuclease RelE of RelBE toxin-antitoxin system